MIPHRAFQALRMNQGGEHKSEQVCPRIQRRPWSRALRFALAWVGPVAGLAALIWFLVRVIPKPSRAAYPCQRAAFPAASAFILWLAGVIGSMTLYRKAKHLARRRRAVASIVVVGAVVCAALALLVQPDSASRADKTPDPPNQPLGTARGFFPGRVVWVHNPAATTWDGVETPSTGDSHLIGQTKGYWGRVDASGNYLESYTSQAVVEDMMAKGLRWLTGTGSDAAAWNALFRHFNQSKGRGSVGYNAAAREKVAIKINLTNTSGALGSTSGINASGNQVQNRRYVDPSVEVMIALLRQLTTQVGVDQRDITIGDTTGTMPNLTYNRLQAAGFTQVVYLGKNVLPGRGTDWYSTTILRWSTPDATGYPTNFAPNSYVQAKYLINLSILKTHALAGVTMCAKNFYGSMIRTPSQSGHYNLHNNLPNVRTSMGTYRPLVDLMGHPNLGGNVMLNVVDGLWTGYDWSWISPPRRWQSPPFTNRWCSSLLFAQDPVAIDSVAYDLWWNEAGYTSLPGPNPRMNAGDDFLHEAALANSPPSGTVYNPTGMPSGRLASLGAHEHWNSGTSRKYSRNLGTAPGLELITAEPTPIRGRFVFYNHSAFDGQSQTANPADDQAVALDKMALLPGGRASSLNYTSYSRGINGVMVDIAGPVGAVNAADFEFKVGNSGNLADWDDAPAPESVTVRPAAGAYGADRVTITWLDGAIKQEWLRVRIKAGGGTGLGSDDVFYFGNAIGGTGRSATTAEVTPDDETLVRNSPHTMAYNPAGIDDPCDFDRDRKVGPTDAILARNHRTSDAAGTALVLITAP